MKYPFLLYASALFSLQAVSQTKAFEEKISITDSMNVNNAREKIFIHYDRPCYRLDDTLWMKGYIVEAAENTSNDSSRVAYVEIINSKNELIKRISPLCSWGLFTASIELNKNEYQQGEYIIRAYTNRMRNFGDSLFYISRFTIIDLNAEEWNTSIHSLSFNEDRFILSASFKGNEKNNTGGQNISVKLRSKNKTLFSAKMNTGYTGNIHIDTLLKHTDVADLHLEIAGKNDLILQLPVNAGPYQPVDLQFLPEGGTFITGKQQRLGFKALNALGKSIDVKGVITNSKGSVVATFASVHAGMGVVTLTPQPNEVYTAVLENGMSVKLPLPQAAGMVLQVFSQPGKDSLQMIIDGSTGLKNRFIYFTAATKGFTVARGKIKFSGKPFVVNLDKKQFASGITVFTLYDQNLLPMNERATFIWHNDDLKLSLTTQKAAYVKKDSVSVVLKAMNGKGENTAGSFSVAVIDTGKIRMLPDAENLLSYMFLSADLRGEIEGPYYYFRQPAPEAVDALLLTQGWVSYSSPVKKFAFPYEREYSISGTVSNIFNKPFVNTTVTLYGKAGKNNAFFLDTVTNDKGGFTFANFPFFTTDSISMVIKALNKRNKPFNVGVELNETSYPPFAAPAAVLNGVIFDDPAVQQYIARETEEKVHLEKDGTYLEEVIVKSKMKIPGSKNLNKDGGSDQAIYESTLDKTPKETLLDVLRKEVKGFWSGILPKSTIYRYMVNTNIAKFIIDGTDIDFFYQASSDLPSSNEYIEYLDGFLKYFSAEDVKGIEIMNFPRNNQTYRSRYLSIEELMSSGPAKRDYSFIEITTRTGSGPFLKKIPGTYLLKPLYPSVSKAFYSPRYASPEQENVFPDMRSTVYWNPEVITNELGEAGFSFYTSESNNSYLIIVQGTDLNGGIGVLMQPLIIAKEEKEAKNNSTGTLVNFKHNMD